MRTVVERKENGAEVDGEIRGQKPALRLPQTPLLQETVPGRGDHHPACLTLDPSIYVHTAFICIGVFGLETSCVCC